MSEFTVEVDRHDLDRYLAAAKAGIGTLVDELAKKLKTELKAESESASKKVSDSWQIEPSDSPDERRVESDVFYAGFLARGTKGHGPTKAPRLVFSVKGNVVSPRFVAGIHADPFHERAIASTEAATAGIIDRLIAGIA